MKTAPFTTLQAEYQVRFYLCFKTQRLQPIFETEAEHSLIKHVVEDVCGRESTTCWKPRSAKIIYVSMKPEQTVSRAVKMLKGNLSRRFGAALLGSLKAT